MRRALDLLYAAALAASCLAMVAIAVLVLAQVGGRVLDRAADLAGFARIGFSVPSLAEFGGYLFAASTFLALPATLRAGGHVRVTLGLQTMPPALLRGATILALAMGLALSVFAAWYLGRQSLTALERGSVSYGLIPIPVWIPQGFMTAGIAIFAVSLLDELVTALRGDQPAFRRAEAERQADPGAH